MSIDLDTGKIKSVWVDPTLEMKVSIKLSGNKCGTYFPHFILHNDTWNCGILEMRKHEREHYKQYNLAGPFEYLVTTVNDVSSKENYIVGNETVIPGTLFPNFPLITFQDGGIFLYAPRTLKSY